MERELGIDVSLRFGTEQAPEASPSRHCALLLQRGRVERSENGGCIAPPVVGFDLESCAAATRERVVLGLPVIFRRSPRRRYPLAFFEPVQRGIEGALTNRKRIVSRLLDPPGDGVTVRGSPAERLQDQQVQRTSENIWCRCGHSRRSPRVSRGTYLTSRAGSSVA